MFDNKLAQRIRKFIDNHHYREFKSGEIARELHIKKHKRRDLEDTLSKMRKTGQIGGKNKRYFALTSSPSQDLIGKLDARPLAKNKSFAFVLQEGKDIYVSREDIMNAYHGDEVTVAIKYTGKDYIHGYVTSIVKRAREQVVGRLEVYRNKYYLVPDNSVLHTDFMVYDNVEAKAGDKVVLTITNWGDPEKRHIPAGKISRVLGKAGDPDVEILSVICDYDLPLEFPEDVIAEASMISAEISREEIAKRVDFRKLYTITIDPASAKDYDDAVSLERKENGFALYVHIADVSHYVKPGTRMWDEAVSRGNSYYFPRKVIPMLPEKLSNGICSLRPHEDKLTMTVLTEYNNEGKIVYQQAMETVICSDNRLSYEQVDNFINKEQTDLPLETQELLNNMRDLSSILQRVRLQRGYLSLNLPETEYVFDEAGHVIDLQRSLETESHQIIENFMLSANEYVSQRLSSGDTIYRIHEVPKPDSIEDLRRLSNVHDFTFDLEHNINHAFQHALDSLETPDRHRVFDRVILRHMQKARYDILNRGHFGLALQTYTHFTSPIRRLCDLVVHLQLKNNINNPDQEADKVVFKKKQLERYAEQATEREIIADNSERDVDEKNKLLFMKKKIGQVFSGIVIAVKSNSLIIELDEYPVRGVIPISSIKDDYYEYHAYYDTMLGTRKAQAIRLADRFKVMLVRVDNDLIFEIINK